MRTIFAHYFLLFAILKLYLHVQNTCYKVIIIFNYDTES